MERAKEAAATLLFNAHVSGLADRIVAAISGGGQPVFNGIHFRYEPGYVQAVVCPTGP